MVTRDELENKVNKRTADLAESNRQLNTEIEEHKHTEQNLRTTELRYRTVADFTYDWEYWLYPDGSLQYISPSCERICGYTIQDFEKNPSLIQDIIIPEDKAVWEEHQCRIQKEMRPKEIQFRIKRGLCS